MSWFHLSQRSHLKGGTFPPYFPHPIWSLLQSGPMKAKYLIHPVTKISEYLKACRNGLKIAFAFLQTGILSSDLGHH